jgi:DNA-binding NarL/FixJ family response regulator
MNRTQLATALRERAELMRARDVQDEQVHDAVELLRVLARIVEGKPLMQAFGAPGVWGHGTPLGAALAACEAGPVKPSGLAKLSRQERNVFDLLVGGSSNKEAGTALGISPKTVAVHLCNLRRKLGGERITQLAVRYGLAPVPP